MFHQVIVTEADTVEQRQGTATVTVIVLDVNDNSPVFTESGYAISVAEGDYSSSPAMVLTVSPDSITYTYI